MVMSCLLWWSSWTTVTTAFATVVQTRLVHQVINDDYAIYMCDTKSLMISRGEAEAFTYHSLNIISSFTVLHGRLR